jgi:hypothetical protein
VFAADGGGFRDCTSVNGIVASNTSGGYEMDNFVITLDMNDQTTSGWTGAELLAININTNIGGGSTNPGIVADGAIIRNPTISITKRTSDGAIGAGISIQTGCPDVQVIGTHTAKPGLGVITMSDYESGDIGHGAFGVVSDGSETTVSGIRVIGTAQNAQEFSNISLRSTDSVVQNCVADAPSQWNGSAHVSRLGVNGNITNAEYEAL